jgi:hypothetical protein
VKYSLKIIDVIIKLLVFFCTFSKKYISILQFKKKI